MGRGPEPRHRVPLRRGQVRASPRAGGRAGTAPAGSDHGPRRSRSDRGQGPHDDDPHCFLQHHRSGWHRSRAEPCPTWGNITGLTDDIDPDILGKQLQLLKDVAPTASKVAFLFRVPPSAVVPVVSRYEAALETGAKSLGLQQRQVHLQGPEDINKAFGGFRQDGTGALLVAYVPVTWSNRRQIIDLATRQRLPAMYTHRTYAVDGGLMSYAEDEREVPRRLAVYVDKILRGAKSADLPIEQPTKFDLVINLKTAAAMGLTIPPSVLGRADEVIRP